MKRKKNLAVMVYIAVLCCCIGFGLIYCAHLASKNEAGTNFEIAEDVIELEYNAVPLGGGND